MFIHEKESSDYSGEDRGPEYLGKNQHLILSSKLMRDKLNWRYGEKPELAKHGNKKEIIDL